MEILESRLSIGLVKHALSLPVTGSGQETVVPIITV